LFVNHATKNAAAPNGLVATKNVKHTRQGDIVPVDEIEELVDGFLEPAIDLRKRADSSYLLGHRCAVVLSLVLLLEGLLPVYPETDRFDYVVFLRYVDVLML
jgi:hypothetical protein